YKIDLLRKPFPPQAHVITALAKALNRQKGVLMVGEMGVGKTICTQAACHAHAAGRGYHALVFAPGQLVGKWSREIEETIPGATVNVIRNFRDVCGIADIGKPAGPVWWIIARDRAKLSSKWHGAYVTRAVCDRSQVPCCPQCFEPVLDKDGLPVPASKLSEKKMFCEHC